MAVVQESGEWRTGPVGRLAATVAALAAAALGYALAEAVLRARTSAAFLVPPTLPQVGGLALSFAVLVGLAIAFELGAPPLAARGGRAARDLRALIRRRFRHARTRADIARAEVGLTVSACCILFVVALVVPSLKALLVVVIAVAILANLQALRALTRLVGYDLRWSALVGFVYGLVGGAVLT